jgi:Fic family protein
MALVGQANRVPAVLQAMGGPCVDGRYLHWDDLIRRPRPEGLPYEEWWLGLKLHRQAARKAVPLADVSGTPFSFVLPDPIPEHLHYIDQSAGGRIEMPEQITNEHTRDRYYVSSLIEEAITSSQLEGAATTRLVAKEMLRSGRPPRDKSEQMILNNYLTMRRIGELKEQPLSPETVLELHRIVTEKTLDDPGACGRLRRPDEVVVVDDFYGEVFHQPPPADQLDSRLAAMCDFANEKTPAGFVHPAVRAIVLHFWLAYDHPFVDGNGRTARALFYWAMLHYGFWLFEFVSISQVIRKAPVQYYRAFLHTETDDNDLTYFLIYHLEVIRRAVDELHAYIRRKTKQLQAVEAKLRGMTFLNHRQHALISHALRHARQVYTVQSHQRNHAVVYQTARTDLLDLAERGLLQKRKRGRTWHFLPAEDLEKRLAELE